jgi:phosphate transport system substrate-binding protein
MLLVADAFVQTPAVRGEIDAALADYHRTTDISGVLRSIGSSTLSNLLLRWKNEFQRLYPALDLQVTGGGSETAPPALINGQAEITPMSRPMSATETQRFHAKFGYAPTRLTAAVNAIAVYVNKHNPLMRLSFRELAEIYAAKPRSDSVPIRYWVNSD